MDISQHLAGVELVVVGGESDREARAFDYAWVLSLREQYMQANVSFDYRQCGSNFILNGEHFRYNPFQLTAKARVENLSFMAI